jgi:hypothetical protein
MSDFPVRFRGNGGHESAPDPWMRLAGCQWGFLLLALPEGEPGCHTDIVFPHFPNERSTAIIVAFALDDVAASIQYTTDPTASSLDQGLLIEDV